MDRVFSSSTYLDFNYINYIEAWTGSETSNLDGSERIFFFSFFFGFKIFLVPSPHKG